MKKKITLLLAILAIFSLAIAAYAYTQTFTVENAACCKGDSCPMKKGEHGTDHSKGEGHNCCGDSCPMKGEHSKSGDHAKMEGHNCCGDSCPMKKKDGEGAAVSASDEGKSCCDNCDCCKDKEKPKTAAV